MRFSVLVGLCLMSGTVPGNAQTFSPGKQIEQSFESSDGGTVPYLLYVPPELEREGERRWPVHLFLHGRGESRGPLSRVAIWGPPRMAAGGKAFDFILVSPQCPTDDFWNSPAQQKRLVELLDRIEAQFPVDQERIVVSGLSMGGYGTWQLALDQPDRFAAVVPICGAGTPAEADRLTGLPVWAWHGDQDQVVPLETTANMVQAIREAGGDQVRFTILEHIGHNSWSPAYATPALWDWLARQKRSPAADGK